MPSLILIRHATTDALGKFLCGRMPGIHLNAAGNDQARILARELAAITDLRAIYSSPLERAWETAQPIAQAHRQEIIATAEFSEVAYGEWTGLTFDQIKQDPRWDLYNRFRSLGSVPGGEGILAVQQRAWRGVAAILERHKDGTVAVVTHADVIRALLLLFLGMPLDYILRLEVAPASISVASLNPGAPPVVNQINASSYHH